jgi:hypothetical protein
MSLVKDLLKNLYNFKQWTYYDKGSRILVGNSHVEIVTECLCITPSDRNYYKVWKKYPQNYFYWHGDITEHRLKYLTELSKIDGIIRIKIDSEHLKTVYGIEHGNVTNYNDYVTIDAISRPLEMQSQYVTYYIKGLMNYPNLANDLRIILDTNYHQIRIHKDDVETLKNRIYKHRNGE